ncbi:MAG: DUF5719 family protein, partial [Promicromonosporaceae bacterium]|nr:DUF5719 family protein [Promicromonosporaceae bacterium]
MRNSLRTAGLAASGLAAVGALVAVAAFGGSVATSIVPTDSRYRDVAHLTQTVQVAPGPVTLVCPPPARLPVGADFDEDFATSPVPTTSTIAVGVIGMPVTAAWGLLGGEPDPIPFGVNAVVRATPLPPDQHVGSLLVAQPKQDAPFHAAGAIAAVTTLGDLRGLAAAPCTEPATSQWLIGGDTAVGSTAVLTVTNPGEQSATITLRVYGEAGPVSLGAQGQFVVGPGAAEQVRLEAVAPGERLLAVQVLAVGGRVAASLQVQRLDGLIPMGTDLIVPVAAARERVVITGLVSDGQAAGEANAPMLRLLAPGDEPVQVALSVYGEDGPVAGFQNWQDELPPNTVFEISLGGLPAGTHAVAIRAEAPVLAAASFTRIAPTPEDALVPGNPFDVAWVPGVPGPPPPTTETRLPGDAMSTTQAALPPGVQATLTLFATPWHFEYCPADAECEPP